MYDIIGDIHGHSKSLEKLLRLLGYTNNDGYYNHSTRKVIFTGDFIDRGPSVRKTLKIVKAMIDNNAAMSVLGNHEYNAICFHTKDDMGNYLRPHNKKNTRQYEQTLKAFDNREDEFREYLQWFKTLPLFIETNGIRVIHASWDFDAIKYIKHTLPNHTLNNNFLLKSKIEGTIEHNAVEHLLKGKEISLPENKFYIDKDGHQRNKIRIKWWIKIHEYTYKELIVNRPQNIPDMKIPNEELQNHIPYLQNNMPVFFGHYWSTGTPKLQKNNVCCVDYSIAKNEKLVAYRWNGEQILNNSNFIFVKNVD